MESCIKELSIVVRCLMPVILLLLTLTSAQELSVSCENICQSTYNQSQEEASYCGRGCRLLRIIDIANNGQLAADDLIRLCSHACEGAYDGGDNNAGRACKLGCQNQLAGVEQRRLQMEVFIREQMRQLVMMDFISRIINCRLFDDNTNNNNGGVRVLIVSSASVIQYEAVDTPRSVDSAPNSAPNSWFSVSSKRTDSRFSVGDVGSHYNSFNDTSLLAMCCIVLVLILGYTYLLCNPPHTDEDIPSMQQYQKLSIYGDGDTLCCVNDVDDPLIDVKSRAGELLVAPPGVVLGQLPVKQI